MPRPRVAHYPILALAALTAAATAAAAQQPDWRNMRSPGEDAWIDAASIVRDGDRVRYWRESRLATPAEGGPGGQAYDRIGGRMEVDCRARTMRTLEMYTKLGERTTFSSPARGEGLRPEPIRRAGSGEADLRAVCLNQWPR
jgi:hypothetical protein